MSHPEQYNIVLLSELSAPTDSAPLTSDGLQLKFEALSNNLINFRISSSQLLMFLMFAGLSWIVKG